MKPEIVKVTVILLVLMSFALCVSSFVAARTCYVSPCYEGNGLALLWMVHDSEGFQVVFLSLFCLLHSISVVYFLFRASYTKFRYGLVLGSLQILVVLLFLQVVWWGTKARMVEDLDEHIGDSYYFERSSKCEARNLTECEDKPNCRWHGRYCVRSMTVSMVQRNKYLAVTATSALLALFQFFLAVMLFQWHQMFADVSEAPASAYSAPPSYSSPSYQK
eukprot:c6690_g1_i1.p1 GENE.c6690_g1_i1~~c6690_g1_i1.p1  ORF type:complete len:219 (+),score=36.08 c6690_g1_i1:29-685(+)